MIVGFLMGHLSMASQKRPLRESLLAEYKRNVEYLTGVGVPRKPRPRAIIIDSIVRPRA
jgi:hypothetical protein